MRKFMDRLKDGIKSWLEIKDGNPKRIVINQSEDLQSYFIKNKIWYRGDSNELEQLYKQLDGKQTTFWGAVPTTGLEIKKSHSGLPKLMINSIANIIIDNYNGVDCDNFDALEIWNEIAEDSNFEELLSKVIKETMAIGDGAIKFSFNPELSQYTLIEWRTGDEVEFVYKRGRLIELIFKSFYKKNSKSYMLKEHYGYGYITYELLDDNKVIHLSELEETAKLKNLTFDKKIIWAVPIKFDDSVIYEGRGASKFDGKYDAFDNFDEIISQWIEAIRLGKPIRYIPEGLCPRDPLTGETLPANPFDNQYIETDGDLSENSHKEIKVNQSDIPSDKYVQAYITYLGLAIQGIISPATLGIDVKKIQDANASYERQLEKTTLYTRQNIITALSKFIPKVINTALNIDRLLKNKAIEDDIKIDVLFGEYDSPSFDNQIDTISKAKNNGIMSIETSVKELYGDSKDDDWIDEEIARLKEEQGIVAIEEPSIAADVDLLENTDIKSD